MRLDISVAKKFDISREKAKKMILSQFVKVGSIIIDTPRYAVKDEDEISLLQAPIYKNEKHIIKPNLETKLNIVHEDDDILVINKQKGLIVHEGASENFNTISNILIGMYGSDFQTVGSAFRPGIVHRLDKDTTGLMIIAKNQKSFEVLTKMIENREITRKYLAVCYGKPRLLAGIISVNIGTDPNDRTKKKAIQIGGRTAITHYKVLESKGGFSFIECKLETGRTHQIRVHLAYLGNAIVGDAIYCKHQKIDGFSSQVLHSYYMEFFHPITGDLMKFQESENFMQSISTFGFSDLYK